MPDDQAGPGHFGHDADVQAMLWIGAAEQILHEILFALHMGEHVLLETLETLGRHGAIVLPPHLVLDRRFADDMLVLRGAARVLAGQSDERAARAQIALFALDRLLQERRLVEVVIDACETLRAQCVDRGGRVEKAYLPHGNRRLFED